MKRITIVGGGITGLATAYHLEQQAAAQGTPVSCTLLEASPRFGGKLVTEHCDGFRIEGGPDSFITTKPAGLELCELLGLSDQLIPSNDKDNSVRICRKGKLIPLPHGFRLAVPTEIGPMLRTPLLSVVGKLRMGMEYFVPPRREDEDESVGSFLRRRIGREATERMAAPLMAGIYMADPDRLSMKSTFPMFADMERKHGSMIKAMLRAKKGRALSPKAPAGPDQERRAGLPLRKDASAGQAARPTSMFLSLREGMGLLPSAILESLQGDRYTNCTVRSVQASETGWQLTIEGDGPATLEADDIVFAVPATTASHLLKPIHPAASTALNKIRYASSSVVILGYENIKHPMRGFGFIVPPDEASPLQACTWLSNKFTDRAPEGGLLVRAFLKDDVAHPLANRSDDELIATARGELKRLVNLQDQPPVVRVFRWQDANPQYDVGHASRVASLEAMLSEEAGLHVAGSPYHGVGIPDCIASAKRIAGKILSQ